MGKVLAKTIFIIWLFQQILTWLFHSNNYSKICTYTLQKCVNLDFWIFEILPIFHNNVPKINFLKIQTFQMTQIVCKLVRAFYANIIYL